MEIVGLICAFLQNYPNGVDNSRKTRYNGNHSNHIEKI